MPIRGINNLPIFDAKAPIALEITDGDVAKSDRKEPADCVVARACRRGLHALEVRVHLSRVYVRMNKGNWQRYETPGALRSEIISFDRGGTFSPGSYVLNPPRTSATTKERAKRGKRQGGKDKYGHARDNPNRKPRAKPHTMRDVRTGPFAG